MRFGVGRSPALRRGVLALAAAGALGLCGWAAGGAAKPGAALAGAALLWLGVAPLVSGIIGRMFGLKHFSTLYGLVFFSHQLGSFCGALLGGVAFDLTGNYVLAWASLIAIGLLAFTLQWPMDDRPPSRRRTGPATAALTS